MSTKQIIKTITINAPAETVWDVLFTDAPYKLWASRFSQGSYFDTDWEEGSKVIFSDPLKSGLIGTVTTNIPQAMMIITYDGQLVDGVEDYDSDEVMDWIKGSKESYELIEDGNETTLNISSEMSDKWYEEMNKAWDKALQTIKELAENS
jgi:hypothetical protein